MTVSPIRKTRRVGSRLLIKCLQKSFPKRLSSGDQILGNASARNVIVTGHTDERLSLTCEDQFHRASSLSYNNTASYRAAQTLISVFLSVYERTSCRPFSPKQELPGEKRVLLSSGIASKATAPSYVNTQGLRWCRIFQAYTTDAEMHCQWLIGVEKGIGKRLIPQPYIHRFNNSYHHPRPSAPLPRVQVCGIEQVDYFKQLDDRHLLVRQDGLRTLPVISVFFNGKCSDVFT